MAHRAYTDLGGVFVNRQNGFTLLEILVAMTLFAVVGGTLLQLFQDGLKQTGRSTEYIHAALLARSKLAELRAFDTLRPGDTEGDFGDGYHWHLTLEEATQLEEPGVVPLTPLNLTLRISWGEQGDRQTMSVNSLLLSRWQP